MLGGGVFYHSQIKKYTSLFGNLFDGIYVKRLDVTGKDVEEFKVPVNLGPREKFLARIQDDPELQRPYSVLLPRISFEFKDYIKAPERQLGATKKLRGTTNNPSAFNMAFVPVPFDLKVELTVYAKHAEDGLQIVESIIPYFTPAKTFRAAILDEIPALEHDMAIILDSVTPLDLYSGDFKQRRIMTWTFDFTLQAVFYGMVKETGVIKIINIDYEELGTNFLLERSTIEPGLTANGQPTSTTDDAIDPLKVQPTDDYGIIDIISDTPKFD